MKISYVLQLKDFLFLFLIGFLLGLFYGFINLFFTSKKPIAIQIVLDIVFSIIAFTLFIIAINLINMGEFRWFLFVGYMLGFFLERIFLEKLFAKVFKKVYNFSIKVFKNFAKSKIGKVILK